MKNSIPCIACKYCTSGCPIGLDIPGALKDFSVSLEKTPSWADICRQREEEAKRMR